MSEEHARYDQPSADERDRGLEPLADILHRFVDQERWTQHLLQTQRSHGQRDGIPVANGRRHG